MYSCNTTVLRTHIRMTRYSLDETSKYAFRLGVLSGHLWQKVPPTGILVSASPELIIFVFHPILLVPSELII